MYNSHRFMQILVKRKKKKKNAVLHVTTIPFFLYRVLPVNTEWNSLFAKKVVELSTKNKD